MRPVLMELVISGLDCEHLYGWVYVLNSDLKEEYHNRFQIGNNTVT